MFENEANKLVNNFTSFYLESNTIFFYKYLSIVQPDFFADFSLYLLKIFFIYHYFFVA